jgi:hypothetical protein
VARTTLKIDDTVLRRIKQLAAAEGRTLQAVANDLLRKALAGTTRERYTLKLRGWKATAQPGVDIADRDKLFEIMDRR